MSKGMLGRHISGACDCNSLVLYHSHSGRVAWLNPRLLEQQALLEQLEGLLSDAFACIDGTDGSKTGEKALRRQGFNCPQQVYQAAYDHLQVSKVLAYSSPS